MAAANDLLAQVLALPTEERAHLAHELLRSLDSEAPEDPEVVERAWAEEIRRRVEEIKTGAVETIPWETVRDELRSELANRKHTR